MYSDGSIPSNHAVFALFHNQIDVVAINASHSAREHSVMKDKTKFNMQQRFSTNFITAKQSQDEGKKRTRLK
jgi:hypothetical protein